MKISRKFKTILLGYIILSMLINNMISISCASMVLTFSRLMRQLGKSLQLCKSYCYPLSRVEYVAAWASKLYAVKR